MTPTAKFRWLELTAEKLGYYHPTARHTGGGYFIVLQQWWEPDGKADNTTWVGEWKDIQMVNE